MKRLFITDSELPDAIVYKWQLEDLVFGNRRGRSCDHCGRLFAPGAMVYKEVREDKFYHGECLKLHREDKERKHREDVKKVLCDMKEKKTNEEVTAMLGTIYNECKVHSAELFETVKLGNDKTMNIYRMDRTDKGGDRNTLYCIISKDLNIKSTPNFGLANVGFLARCIDFLQVDLRKDPVCYYKDKYTHAKFKACYNGTDAQLPSFGKTEPDEYLQYITYLCPDL
jgi:hypothetical protein